jgi:hypothetical protein
MKSRSTVNIQIAFTRSKAKNSLKLQIELLKIKNVRSIRGIM